ncbi:type II toxin-antitoxin system PemK/MazF family toxin [Aliarcobacter butzleri]|nr:type II toxin-antitoxin system PemK/MazF family toxin [Aliarcobacter butzleri]
MGIVISKNITNSSITILPLTETKIGDLENISRVVLLKNDYGFINKDTTILIDNITTIEKKKRVVGIKLKWIPSPLRRKIQRAMLSSFK